MSRRKSEVVEGLTSPKAKCRILGCATSVPHYGGCPGMTQAHCPYCGVKTTSASDYCEDYCDPIYPESQFCYIIIEKIKNLLT